MISYSQSPITKEGLLRSLSRRALSSRTLVLQVQQRGVTFQLTASDEQEIRRAGEYLGSKGLDALIEAIRSNVKSLQSAPTGKPIVALRFVYPKNPALMIVNTSDWMARDIKWVVALWNMDLPERNDPLPIPVSTFDWIKPRDEGGPQNLFGSPLVSPLLKPGNRLIGSATVDCPECVNGKTYFVYIVWGSGGWYSEIEDEKSGKLIIPINFLKETREQYFKEIEALVPEKSRIPIGERAVEGVVKKQSNEAPPPQVKKLTYSQEVVSSDKEDAPYAVKVVIQTNVTIQPTSLAISCDTPFTGSKPLVSFSNGGEGYVGTNKVYWLFFKEPAFRPEYPIMVLLMAKSPIRVLAVSEGPPIPR